MNHNFIVTSYSMAHPVAPPCCELPLHPANDPPFPVLISREWTYRFWQRRRNPKRAKMVSQTSPKAYDRVTDNRDMLPIQHLSHPSSKLCPKTRHLSPGTKVFRAIDYLFKWLFPHPITRIKRENFWGVFVIVLGDCSSCSWRIVVKVFTFKFGT